MGNHDCQPNTPEFPKFCLQHNCQRPGKCPGVFWEQGFSIITFSSPLSLLDVLSSQEVRPWHWAGMWGLTADTRWETVMEVTTSSSTASKHRPDKCKCSSLIPGRWQTLKGSSFPHPHNTTCEAELGTAAWIRWGLRKEQDLSSLCQIYP